MYELARQQFEEKELVDVTLAAEGKVWLSYNSPAYLQQRHRLDTPPLGAIIELLQTATRQVNSARCKGNPPSQPTVVAEPDREEENHDQRRDDPLARREQSKDLEPGKTS